jgi:amino acid transporter
MSERSKAPTPAPGASFWRTLQMVAWSFFGIRNSSESQHDMARVKPFHLIVAGMAGAALLVIGLMLLVNWVVAK